MSEEELEPIFLYNKKLEHQPILRCDGQQLNKLENALIDNPKWIGKDYAIEKIDPYTYHASADKYLITLISGDESKILFTESILILKNDRGNSLPSVNHSGEYRILTAVDPKKEFIKSDGLIKMLADYGENVVARILEGYRRQNFTNFRHQNTESI